MDLTMMERVGDREEKMEGYCSTGQSPQRAVLPVEEEEDIKINVLVTDFYVDVIRDVAPHLLLGLTSQIC
jgi:hypothetical protein